MIIFGTRGVTTTPESGHFHCPSCNTMQNYRLKRVRRFFTLYFIPLIPLDKLGEYVECVGCKDAYKPSVLDNSTNQSDADFEAEYHSAVKKIMIHVLLADGVVDESEVAMARGIYEKITGKTIDQSRFREEISRVQTSREGLSNVLSRLQGTLNESGKELVVKAAFLVAAADGEVHDSEQDLIARIGAGLGMRPAHIKGVLSSA